MKILYAIQGTGNGHLSRAAEILPHLQNHGEVDIFVSGCNSELNLPYLVKYRNRGISFCSGKRGGINYWESMIQFRPFHFMRDVFNFPVEKYDLILNDFEPVTAWACRLKHRQCIGMGHQASFLSEKTPRPLKRNNFSEKLLVHFAPVCEYVGFHFCRYDHLIYTPVIKKSIRESEVLKRDHFTVYLPAYADNFLIKILNRVDEVSWEIFSKSCYRRQQFKNVTLFPVTAEGFNKSMISCDGVLCGAGFETPAEAMFLKKKLMVILMKGQYEQACNGAALNKMGVKTLRSFDTSCHHEVLEWIQSSSHSVVDYPDTTSQIIETTVMKYSFAK